MKLSKVNGTLCVVNGQASMPVQYVEECGNTNTLYVLTARGSYIFCKTEGVIAKPSQGLIEPPPFVYRFGRWDGKLIKGNTLNSTRSAEDHILNNTKVKCSRFLSTAYSISGVYHFLAVTSQLVGLTFDEFVELKQSEGCVILKIKTRACPGAWLDMSKGKGNSKTASFAKSDKELTLDGIIPAKAIADIGIITRKGYIQWQRSETPEYPHLSDRVLDMVYPE